jgi:Spy/CpxP family protein refolding chaperone
VFEKQLKELMGNLINPDVDAKARMEIVGSLQRIVENEQVVTLFEFAKNNKDAEIRQDADSLVKQFMDAHTVMLQHHNKQYQIGTPADFTKWIAGKYPYS